jgi:tetratricopeptide (TPR) repeat protein
MSHTRPFRGGSQNRAVRRTAAKQLAPEDAGAHTKQAIAPDSAAVNYILGNVLFFQGRHDEAIASYQQALRINPAFAEAYSNLANVLSALERYEEAVSNCQQALRLKPNYAKAYVNLGNAYIGLDRRDEAIACYQQGLKLDPNVAEAHNGLGAALMALDQLDGAIAHCRDALRLKPDFAAAYYNLGLALSKQTNWDDAVAPLQQAVRLRPNHAEAHYRLGGALGEQGKLEEARDCFERALGLKPDYADARWAFAYSWLLGGDFEKAWPYYEWRWRVKGAPQRPFLPPVWDGSPLSGRTILLHAEQGFGDTIQFVRYAALVKQSGGTVIVECQKPLRPLLESCPGIDHLVVAGSELPAFDFQAPLLSVPRILKTSLATVPAQIPYLFPSAEREGKWRRRLARYPGFKIGIAWQGNPRYGKDRQRSLRLVDFAILARVEGVCLISLQKGPGAEQLCDADDSFPVINLGSDLDTKCGAFMDTAAVMKSLDLVIAPDTAIAHLAGALGVPAWVALSYVPDWRWLLEREDSPWYPSMRLFRQTQAGDWNGVFERMALRLSERLGAKTSPRPLTVEIAPGELIDKITILEIKAQKMSDPSKRGRICAECEALKSVRDRNLGQSEEIARLTFELQAVNQRLWQVEDEIRLCEKAKDFGPRFIELARSVYHENDRRAALKRRINELLGSRITEEKCYMSCK